MAEEGEHPGAVHGVVYVEDAVDVGGDYHVGHTRARQVQLLRPLEALRVCHVDVDEPPVVALHHSQERLAAPCTQLARLREPKAPRHDRPDHVPPAPRYEPEEGRLDPLPVVPQLPVVPLGRSVLQVRSEPDLLQGHVRDFRLALPPVGVDHALLARGVVGVARAVLAAAVERHRARRRSPPPQRVVRPVPVYDLAVVRERRDGHAEPPLAVQDREREAKTEAEHGDDEAEERVVPPVPLPRR
mmetsp:Transcript_30903/g.69347  ORF Transcript_30903/g.69347 Transcript_30903/m.69347 type:complete len:243 (-) Transcript_30903:1725-2453(-)